MRANPLIAGDVEPPLISSITPEVDWNRVRMRWRTHEPATSFLEWGLPGQLVRSRAEDGLRMVHEFVLEELAPETEYSFRASGRDAAGNRGVSGMQSFRTLAAPPSFEVTGTGIVWHPLTLTFEGPYGDEQDQAPNPFLDYRLTVGFIGPSQQVYPVPGFFDGDGRGGGTGNAWRVRFAPDEPGPWRFEVDFKSGEDLAVDLDLNHGAPLAFHGLTGTVQVAPRDPRAPGFLKWGRLEYVGGHYPKFRDGPYFLKGGVDSPENLLAYHGFDNTRDQDGGVPTLGLQSGLHFYGPHVGDWGPAEIGGLGDASDPLFTAASGYDSRGIVGALNYLASVGINSVYFLPMNLGGDGWDTCPFVSYANTAEDKRHYDVSKLGQWNAVFEHATRRGIQLHVVLGETEPENETWLDGGQLGVERKLYYREMVARFSHNLAIKWNLSEENDFDHGRVTQFAGWLQRVDPYLHPIAFHTHVVPVSGQYAAYSEVLGDPRLSSTSIQTDPEHAGALVEYWRQLSKAAGMPWAIEIDELTPYYEGVTDTNAPYMRKATLWDIYFSGGHVEYYCGYHPLPLGGDVNLEDFRTREAMWISMQHARRFLEELPFWEMQPHDEWLTGEDQAFGGGEVFALPGEVYAVYLPRALSTGTLDLTHTDHSFVVHWYNPSRGVFVGAPRFVAGGAPLPLGPPPFQPEEDWVCRVMRVLP